MVLGLVYIFSTVLMLQSNSILVLWFSMELNTLIFLFILKVFEEMFFNSEFWIKYFLIQSFLSFFLLFFLLNLSTKWFILELIMLMKMGFPPFHLWLVDLLKCITFFQFFVLSTIQKLPFFLILKLIGHSSDFWIGLIMLNMFTIMAIFLQPKLIWFLFFSGINFTMEIILLIDFMVAQIVLWIIFYSMLLFFFQKKMSQSISPLKMGNKIDESMLLTVLISGLPPFNFFLMKFLILSLLFNYSLLSFFIYLWFSFILLFYYMQFFSMSKLLNYYNMTLNKFNTISGMFVYSMWVWNIFM